jgi:RNA polymerase sigma-70 factor (ECF subfamily)
VLSGGREEESVEDRATWLLPSNVGSDEEIISQVLAGEVHQFEVIVRRHTPRLKRIAISVLRNECDAEEVVQDALVSAYQHLSQFAGRAKFITWLTRIALYKAMGRANSRAREVRLDNEEGQEPNWLVYRGPTPEQSFSASETASLLGTAIQALPETYRRVLVMRDIHEVDTETAARQLRITETNVKVRLHRARTMLRREWERAITPPVGVAGAATFAASSATQ